MRTQPGTSLTLDGVAVIAEASPCDSCFGCAFHVDGDCVNSRHSALCYSDEFGSVIFRAVANDPGAIAC